MIYRKLKVVCFGGGTGLPALLSGLKHNPWLEITALVNMFDSGGSSGELKDRFGILPPGDVLKCLLALSEDEFYARQLLQKRIRNQIYSGHTGGNVLLLGFEKVYGDYLSAVEALGQLLSIKGKVVPITIHPSNLCARYTDGSCHTGETSVDLGVHEGKVIKDLFLDPVVPASEQAFKAIEEADIFCIGPGSFYTSVLPNFLPSGAKEALSAAKGKIIFIANLLTEGRGMQGIIQMEEIVALVERYIDRTVDHVIANNHCPISTETELYDKYAMENKYPITPKEQQVDSRFILGDLWLDKEIARHDCARLANLVSAVINLSVHSSNLSW